MKRNISRDQRIRDSGRSPNEKSYFSIYVKEGEKNRGMERKRRGVKIGGANMSMSVSIVVSKCFHQCQRGTLLKDQLINCIAMIN
jgi:hypothetical protein